MAAGRQWRRSKTYPRAIPWPQQAPSCAKNNLFKGLFQSRSSWSISCPRAFISLRSHSVHKISLYAIAITHSWCFSCISQVGVQLPIGHSLDIFYTRHTVLQILERFLISQFGIFMSWQPKKALSKPLQDIFLLEIYHGSPPALPYI